MLKKILIALPLLIQIGCDPDVSTEEEVRQRAAVVSPDREVQLLGQEAMEVEICDFVDVLERYGVIDQIDDIPENWPGFYVFLDEELGLTSGIDSTEKKCSKINWPTGGGSKIIGTCCLNAQGKCIFNNLWFCPAGASTYGDCYGGKF